MRAVRLFLVCVASAGVEAMVRGILAAFEEDALGLGLAWLPVLDAWERFEELCPAAFGLGAAVAILSVAASRLARACRRVRLLSIVGLVVAAVAGGLIARNALLGLASPTDSALSRLLWDQRLFLRNEPLETWLWVAGIALALFLLGGRRRSARPVRVALVTLLPVAAICSAGLATALHRSAAGEDGARHVFLVVLDTVGAGHLASYGHDTVTTAELDALADRGLRFQNSYAVAPWTLPTHASMFTGLHPIRHGATQERLFLSRSFATLAEILEDAGYHTFAAVNNAVVSKSRQLDQGFSTFLAMRRRDAFETYRGRGRHPTNAAVAELLEGLEEGERAFVFLNYIEAHYPYDPPAALARPHLEPEWLYEDAVQVDQRWDRHYTGESDHDERDWKALRGLYRGELAALSATIGDLVRVLEESGVLDESLVIVTSDHGENLGEHDHLAHVFSMHDTLLHVPLFIFGKGIPAGVERMDPVSSADLYYTILSAAGCTSRVEVPQGRDLLAPGAEQVAVPLVAEYAYPRQLLDGLGNRGRDAEGEAFAPFLRRMRSIRDGDWKLVVSSDGLRRLYDIGSDPREEHDLSELEPERVVELEELLRGRLEMFAGRRLDTVVEHPDQPLGPLGFRQTDPEADELRRIGYTQ